MVRNQSNQSGGTFVLPYLGGAGSGLSPESQQLVNAFAQNYSDQRAKLESEAPKRNILGNIALGLIAGPGAAMMYNNAKKNQYQQKLAGFDNSYLNAVGTLGTLLNSLNTPKESAGNVAALSGQYPGLEGEAKNLSNATTQELLRGGSAYENTPLIQEAAAKGLATGSGAGNSQLANLLGQIGAGKMPQVKTVTQPMKRVVTPSAQEQLNADGFTNQEVGKTAESFGLDLSQPETAPTPQAGILNAGIDTAQRPQAGYFSPETYNTLAQLLGGTAKTAYSEAPNYAKTPSEIAKNEAAAAYDRAGVGLRREQTRQTSVETSQIVPNAQAERGLKGAQAKQALSRAAKTQVETNRIKELLPLEVKESLNKLDQSKQSAYISQIQQANEGLNVAKQTLKALGAVNKNGAVNLRMKFSNPANQNLYRNALKQVGDSQNEVLRVQKQVRSEAIQTKAANWLEQLGN